MSTPFRKRKYYPSPPNDTYDAGPTLSVADVAALPSGLRSLSVGWLPLKAAVALAASQEALTDLTLWRDEPTPEGSPLRVLTSLRSLNWWANENSVSDVLNEIGHVSRLQTLSLMGAWLRRDGGGSGRDGESWEPLKCLPNLCHLNLEYASGSHLEALVRSPESNISTIDVLRKGDKSDSIKSIVLPLLAAKRQRLKENRARLDQVLVLLAHALQQSEIPLPVEIMCKILEQWASSGAFYGTYQRAVDQVVRRLWAA